MAAAAAALSVVSSTEESTSISDSNDYGVLSDSESDNSDSEEGSMTALHSGGGGIVPAATAEMSSS
ncbi:hypothetical protein GGF44_004076, partial [Coemansia sp. RSA 1694]